MHYCDQENNHIFHVYMFIDVMYSCKCSSTQIFNGAQLGTMHAVSSGGFTCRPLQATQKHVFFSPQHDLKSTTPLLQDQNPTFTNEEPCLSPTPVAIKVHGQRSHYFSIDDIPFIDE